MTRMFRKSRFIQMLALVVSLFTLSASCAYVLHPERRNSGRTSGRIDTMPLVLDILWFLPGIIPGVVALIVDFTTGAIYVDSFGAKPLTVHGVLAVRVPGQNKTTRLSLRVTTPDGRTVARRAAWVHPGEDPAQKLRVNVDDAARMAARLGANGHDLTLHLDGLGLPVQLPLRVE